MNRMRSAIRRPFLFLETPNREPVRPAVSVLVERSTAEEHVTGVRTTGRHRRRPVVAVGTLTVGRTVIDVPIARSRQNQLKAVSCTYCQEVRRTVPRFTCT